MQSKLANQIPISTPFALRKWFCRSLIGRNLRAEPGHQGQADEGWRRIFSNGWIVNC